MSNCPTTGVPSRFCTCLVCQPPAPVPAPLKVEPKLVSEAVWGVWVRSYGLDGARRLPTSSGLEARE